MPTAGIALADAFFGGPSHSHCYGADGGCAGRIFRPMRTRMLYRGAIGSITLALALLCALAGAQAFDQSQYPDLMGQWRRFEVGPVKFDPSKPRLAQGAPLTPEYQAIFEANLRDQDAGGEGIDPTYTCLAPGMPRQMNACEPMEIVVTPDTTHILMPTSKDQPPPDLRYFKSQK
jgi:hypothetical protein